MTSIVSLTTGPITNAFTGALPGLGLVIAVPVLTALTCARNLTGGIIRALVGSGIPKEHTEHYENNVKEGGIIIGVAPKSIADRATTSEWRSCTCKSYTAATRKSF